MATSSDYISFVMDSISSFPGEKRFKKMFGEYMVYINEKPVLLICDDTVYVKMLSSLTELMQESETGTPYKGAKDHYILDIENRELIDSVLSILEREIPIPKKKTKK